mgnify:CR=1 FL=1
MFDNVFYCDGVGSQGFGHVARCIMLAQLLVDERSARSIAFCGNYDAAVLDRIRGNLSSVSIVPANCFPKAGTAIVDRMAHPEDPDEWDEVFLETVCAKSAKVVYIASGTLVPPPREKLISVGYQPFAGNEPRSDVFWGMKYAPVPPGFRTAASIPRDRSRAFVGIGGGGDRRSLATILEALDGIAQIRSIDVLVSPVARYETAVPEVSKSIAFHSNVPTITPFLSAAGLVVASFGNLMMEALCLGAPVSIVGQKKFQAAFGQHFENAKLAYYAGDSRTAGREALAAIFEKTLAIDDKGLVRIAALINGAGWDSPARGSAI